MRAIPLFALLILAAPVAAGTEEGTVTSIDGKGGFQVATVQSGVINLQAVKDLMGKQLPFKNPSWPHIYKDLQVGDYIEVDRGIDKRSGKIIARSIRIKKRGG